ncbi:MAG: NADH-quinone oxidoreductase subunit J [Verrucomicrobia bacterium]|nr:NADH-quinone oxidoreductase subunit J [Verrucomicrobiota bacterium]
MNSAAFISIAVVTLFGALCAGLLPRLIHAALAFAVAFITLAALYLLLGAEFVGLVQVFVYVGAVAVLIVFTILLTRRDAGKDRGVNWSGVIVACAVFGGLLSAIVNSRALAVAAPAAPPLTVKAIGHVLMTDYGWPLQCAGVLLTVALLGAVLIALEEKR